MTPPPPHKNTPGRPSNCVVTMASPLLKSWLRHCIEQRLLTTPPPPSHHPSPGLRFKKSFPLGVLILCSQVIWSRNDFLRHLPANYEQELERQTGYKTNPSRCPVVFRNFSFFFNQQFCPTTQVIDDQKKTEQLESSKSGALKSNDNSQYPDGVKKFNIDRVVPGMEGGNYFTAPYGLCSFRLSLVIAFTRLRPFWAIHQNALFPPLMSHDYDVTYPWRHTLMTSHTREVVYAWRHIPMTSHPMTSHTHDVTYSWHHRFVRADVWRQSILRNTHNVKLK